MPAIAELALLSGSGTPPNLGRNLMIFEIGQKLALKVYICSIAIAGRWAVHAACGCRDDVSFSHAVRYLPAKAEDSAYKIRAAKPTRCSSNHEHDPEHPRRPQRRCPRREKWYCLKPWARMWHMVTVTARTHGVKLTSGAISAVSVAIGKASLSSPISTG